MKIFININFFLYLKIKTKKYIIIIGHIISTIGRDKIDKVKKIELKYIFSLYKKKNPNSNSVQKKVSENPVTE